MAFLVKSTSLEKGKNLLLIACLQSMLANGSIRNNSQTWIADMIVSTVFTTFIFISTTKTPALISLHVQTRISSLFL